MPDLRATFVPGGFDDFSMPEVVAPAPKRVTPQIPQNIQDDVQRMELEAGPQGPDLERRQSSMTTMTSLVSTGGSFDRRTTTASGFGSPAMAESQWHRSYMSPFPRSDVDNMPPTDEERQINLHKQKSPILHSGNFEAQLNWAQDALNWIEIQNNAADREAAISGTGDPRPPSQVEHEICTDAVDIIEHLEQQQHPQALVMVGNWLESGKFDKPLNKRQAFNKYRIAAQADNARAEYHLGMMLERSNEMDSAKECYIRGMGRKDTACLYQMGMMYLLGLHSERKDFQRGLECIKASADLAGTDPPPFPQGAYFYGMLIIRDLGEIVLPEELLAHNPNVARTYISKAAVLGSPEAQLKMGQAYELCQLGCAFKPKVSLRYYKLAANQGLPEAALGASRWLLFGYDGLSAKDEQVPQDEQFPKDEQLAYKYAEEAAFAKLPTGEFAMGYFWEVGVHVAKDVAKAKWWYEQAATHGVPDARDRLRALERGDVLGKQYHDKETLTRIKSLHGSQRGKRPDRFKQRKDYTPAVPTVSESVGPPVSDASTTAPPQMMSPRQSPRLDDMGALPNKFTNNSMSPIRAKPYSTAPYPDDDLPGGEALPYPDDDLKPAGWFNQGLVTGDRPSSAYGLRPLVVDDRSRTSSPMVGTQNQAANLVPPMVGDSRIGFTPAGWDSQPSSNTRRPSPTPVRGQGFDQRSVSNPAYDEGGYGPIQPVANLRGKPAGHFSTGPDDYGNPGGAFRSNFEQFQGQNPPDSYGRLGKQPRAGQAGQGYHLPQLRNELVRAGSAPPSSQQQAVSPARMETSTSESNQPPVSGSVQAPTPSTKLSTGPATFEAMGIPQAKRENDCVVM